MVSNNLCPLPSTPVQTIENTIVSGLACIGDGMIGLSGGHGESAAVREKIVEKVANVLPLRASTGEKHLFCSRAAGRENEAAEVGKCGGLSFGARKSGQCASEVGFAAALASERLKFAQEIVLARSAGRNVP